MLGNDVIRLRREKRVERAKGLLKRLACSWFTPLLFVPVYLLSVCLFLNITNSVSFNIPLLESIFRPFPEARLVQTGLALLFVDLVRVLICRKLTDNNDDISDILALFVLGSFMIAIGFLHWSNVPSHEERARYNAEKSCSDLVLVVQKMVLFMRTGAATGRKTSNTLISPSKSSTQKTG